jgi:hypothetical protein
LLPFFGVSAKSLSAQITGFLPPIKDGLVSIGPLAMLSAPPRVIEGFTYRFCPLNFQKHLNFNYQMEDVNQAQEKSFFGSQEKILCSSAAPKS